MHTCIIRGVSVTFPFEPYPLQKVYMEKVIECLQDQQNGVLESPTGTGKTLSLLCSSAAWLEVKKAQTQVQRLYSGTDGGDEENYMNTLQNELTMKAGMNKNSRAFLGIPTIIYSSRTHSQLSQAMRELKRTAYSHLKSTAIGSRDQLCIHPEVLREENKTNKVAFCHAKIATRSCYLYNRVEKFKGGVVAEGPSQVVDIEDLVKFGQMNKCCPYYMAKELKQQSDIVFMPYNYLIDPRARKAVDLELSDSIVIIDEAHNIERICEDSASFQIKTTDVALCIEEITEAMKSLSENTASFNTSEVPKDFDADDLCNLKQIFLDFEKVLDGIDVNVTEGTTYPGDYIFEILAKAGINHANYSIFTNLIGKLVQFLATARDGPFARKGNSLQLIEDFLNVVFVKNSTEYKDKIKKCYKVHVIIEEPKKKKSVDTWLNKGNLSKKSGCVVLNYWCFSPGFGMSMLMNQGVRCVILTSGTLAPLGPLISELELNINVRLENPHIVDGDQVCVKILCKGPDTEVLNCNYQNRNNAKYLTSVGQTVLNLSKVIPDGILVFFPSYPVLQNFKEHWQEKGIWSNICAHKPIFVEPKDKDAFNNVMNEYYAHIKSPEFRGAIFFGVCRGKVSEGLDFADINGRAVLIIGLPYPPLKDPRVILKKKYLDTCNAQNKEYLRGDDWYSLEASRSVNQAIGRVIRHQHDYGAIILLDSRFNNPRIRNQISKWLQKHIKLMNNFGEIMRDLSHFFKKAKALPLPQLKTVKSEVETKLISPRKTNFDFTTNIAGSSKRNCADYQPNPPKRTKINVRRNVKSDSDIMEEENKTYIMMVKNTLAVDDYQQFVKAIALYKDTEDFGKFTHCLDVIFSDKVHLRYVIQGLKRFIKREHKQDFETYWEKTRWQ